MVRSLIFAIIVLLPAAVARADLQLVPKLSEYEVDGAKLQQLEFSDGSGQAITYSPPRGWKYDGEGTRMTLYPPTKSEAKATIFVVRLPEPGSFDETSTKKLVEELPASAPRGSTDVQVVLQQKNPLMIDGKETFLTVLSYKLGGESYNYSVLFLNRIGGKEQVRFQLVCRSADFKELQRAFLGSQYSWQGL
jgi:hypothetical protein